ncbi:hypothetical protein [Sulfuricaulis sp.]|jgi:hypothetical protein|uniref:hypothetical protein n=1 Tax=Sulfuricaulis sp. TaxID=2003553 RepID=UPI00355AC359
MDNARCPFEKAILSVQCTCEMATRFSVAEQMGVECRSDIARNNCATLLAFMRARARFVLKVTDTSASLPFGKEMKVMLGGLIGLQRQMATEEGAAAAGVQNIHALVQQAQAAYGSLDALPYQEIVKSIAAFQGKRRGNAHPSR